MHRSSCLLLTSWWNSGDPAWVCSTNDFFDSAFFYSNTQKPWLLLCIVRYILGVLAQFSLQTGSWFFHRHVRLLTVAQHSFIQLTSQCISGAPANVSSPINQGLVPAKYLYTFQFLQIFFAWFSFFFFIGLKAQHVSVTSWGRFPRTLREEDPLLDSVSVTTEEGEKPKRVWQTKVASIGIPKYQKWPNS